MARDVFRAYQNTSVYGWVPMETKTQGTIHEAPNFDPKMDCVQLKQALRGFGTDKRTITSILVNRSNNQRQIIKSHFSSMFSEDLVKEIKRKLCGNYERTVLELLMPHADYDAYNCRNAIVDVPTDEHCLIEVLATRSNKDILAIRDAYQQMYNSDLQKDIHDDICGHYRRFLFSLVQGRSGEYEPVDHIKASQDAHELYADGAAQWGTEKSRINMILATRSFPQLRLMFDEYEKLSERAFEDSIENTMSDDLKDGMFAIVKCARNRPAYFAERLYMSLKDQGKDDETLIRIMVSRSEIDMMQINEEFFSKYSKTLETFIDENTSGEYKNILIQLSGVVTTLY